MPTILEPFTLQQTDESIGLWPFFKIQVGSSLFSVSADTHSSVTWLYSDRIPLSDRGDRSIYDPKSTVAFGKLQNLSTTYGDGLEVHFDRVYLDELGCGKSTQPNQMIFGASSIRRRIGISQSQLMEGILALKPRYDAESTHRTVWATLAPNLPNPVFVAELKFDGRGEYTFGTIPYRETDLKFWNGEDRDIWRLPIVSYAIGQRTTKYNTKTSINAAVDTGCSSLFLPSCIVRDYYATVPGHILQDGLYIVPSRQDLPDLFFYIGKEQYQVRIPGTFLKPQGMDGCSEDFCSGRLQECTDLHGAILGHPFLFAQTVIFRGVHNLSVGLVERKARRPDYTSLQTI